MAFDKSEIPPEVQDILDYMPREMQQRVLTDYESHYAPFLSMLAGWKQAVLTHHVQGEESAINRLEEEFFPLDTWRFPCQTLAVPQRPPDLTTEITPISEFKDAINRPWLSGGVGWLQPVSLNRAMAYSLRNVDAVVADIDHVGAGSIDAVLERGLLAYIATPEEMAAAMARGAWWVQTPDGRLRALTLTRYTGYMNFEREIQTASINQRHTDLWLPPFYPYSRKMVRLRLARDTDGTPPPRLNFLDPLRSGFRIIGTLPELNNRLKTLIQAEAASKTGGKPLLYLNAVPVLQTAILNKPFYAPLPRIGNEFALRTDGVQDISVVVAYHDNVAVPSTMFRVPSNNPKATEDDIEVRFPQSQTSNTALVKLYYQSIGQERADNSDTPSVLEMSSLRFNAPFRAIGGQTIGAPKERKEWARRAWYQSVLRPPLMTEGDVIEVIRQRQGAFGELLRFDRSGFASREILHEVDEGSAHWRSYLWPSVIAKETSFDTRYGEIPAENYIPMVQCLRLAFERGPSAALVPDFLLADVADYMASIISQYFVLSCFRVEGRVV